VKNKISTGIVAVIGILFNSVTTISAQTPGSLSLEEAISLALQNNHMLTVRKLQIEEKEQKVSEDKVKYLPSVTIGGSYQYNSNLPALAIEQGRFGELPFGGIVIPLPAADEIIEMGNHNIYNAGVSFYQPVSQIGKISAGVSVSRMEFEIAKTEKNKAEFQVRQAVEKLFFGLLITVKQITEAEIKLNLARTKLYDAENALASGKATESGIYGLSAAAADEEQNLLKLKIQYDDYADDLKQLTGIDQTLTIIPEPVPVENLTVSLPRPDTSINGAVSMNNDIRIASLLINKADYSIRAGKFSFLPDLGIQGGYSYQKGSVIYPKNNAFIGASVRWNLQDAFSNRTILKQRTFARDQAREILSNTTDQVRKDLIKAYRKLKQSEELMNVAAKGVDFRREDLRIQNDRYESGLILDAGLLEAKATMARAESDYLAARLNYRLALSEIKILRGDY